MKKTLSLIVIVIWLLFWTWVAKEVIPYYSMDNNGTLLYYIKSVVVFVGNMVFSFWLIARVFGFSLKELNETLMPDE